MPPRSTGLGQVAIWLLVRDSIESVHVWLIRMQGIKIRVRIKNWDRSWTLYVLMRYSTSVSWSREPSRAVAIEMHRNARS